MTGFPPKAGPGEAIRNIAFAETYPISDCHTIDADRSVISDYH
jgi:hypothetical protein